MEIKKGDAVKIIAGKDKGATGQVIRVYPAENRIVVEGVNIVHKCVRARRANEKSGIVEQPAAFDASNAMVICPVCHEATRLSHAVQEGRSRDEYPSLDNGRPPRNHDIDRETFDHAKFAVVVLFRPLPLATLASDFRM